MFSTVIWTLMLIAAVTVLGYVLVTLVQSVTELVEKERATRKAKREAARRTATLAKVAELARRFDSL